MTIWRRVEVVGPTVGKELLHAGILATVLAMLAISLYVGVRFEWQFGLAALIATFHDVLTTVGFFAVLHLDFNLTAVAALLTLAGYSINDTVDNSILSAKLCGGKKLRICAASLTTWSTRLCRARP